MYFLKKNLINLFKGFKRFGIFLNITNVQSIFFIKFIEYKFYKKYKIINFLDSILSRQGLNLICLKAKILIFAKGRVNKDFEKKPYFSYAGSLILNISISHSNTKILGAVSQSTPLGIDKEYLYRLKIKLYNFIGRSKLITVKEINLIKHCFICTLLFSYFESIFKINFKISIRDIFFYLSKKKSLKKKLETFYFIIKDYIFMLLLN